MLVLIPGLVILIGLLGVLLFLPGGNEQVYVQQITQARKMVESGDYQKAIVYFQNAIKEDKTKEEPYIELANIYFSLNMRDEGIAILREGIQTTNSVKIIQVLNEYENSGNGFSFTNYNAHEMLGIINYAKQVYFEKKRDWNRIVERAMSIDFSWKVSANRYEGLYRYLLGMTD